MRLCGRFNKCAVDITTTTLEAYGNQWPSGCGRVTFLGEVEDEFPHTGTFNLRFREDMQRLATIFLGQSSFLSTKILRTYHVDSDSHKHLDCRMAGPS